jgi:hypothetical protein
MMLRLPLPLLLVSACAPGVGNAAAELNSTSNQSGVKVAQPAGATASGPNDVIGATPGACGATRAREFLGRTYGPEMDKEMMRASGATAIRRIPPTGEDANGGPMVDTRMNVVLNDFGQIVLLDCG